MFYLKELHAKGFNIKQIARMTGHDPKTVRKCIEAQELPQYKPRPTRPSKLDPFKPYLADLLDAELAARRERYLKVRIRLAHLLFHKTLDQFGFGFQPSIVANATNVLFLGPPGVGKTHLAVALGLAAIEQGLAVYFVTAHTLVQDLRRAHAENRLERRLQVYTAPKLLIIDELRYLTMDSLEATLFFQLISARYTRGSIILTSNRASVTGARSSGTR